MSAFTDIDVRATVTAAVIETFGALLSMDIRPEPEVPPPGQGLLRMVGTLHFAGEVTGIFNAQIPFDFGRRMAAALLEAEPKEEASAAAIRDVVAQITAAVGGDLKSALNDAGCACGLSTPSITHGTDFSIGSLNLDRFERYAFRNGEHIAIIEVGLRQPEGADAVIDPGSPDGAGRVPHVDPQELDSLDYGGRLAGAIVEAFDARFALELERTEPMSAEDLSGMRYVASVGFAGDAAGIVRLNVGRELSRRMAANRLGKEPAEIEGAGDIDAVLGELGDIVGGSLRSALTDAGRRCALSAPSFTIGGDFRIESLDLDRFERRALRHNSDIVSVEMGLKIPDPLRPEAPAERDARPHGEEAMGSAGRDDPSDPFAMELDPAGAKNARPEAEDLGLALLLDIPVELTVELGRTRMPIRELLKLRPGSAVKLAKLEGESVDILAKDVLIARGEVVVRHEKYGIRITEITSRLERLKGLK